MLKLLQRLWTPARPDEISGPPAEPLRSTSHASTLTYIPGSHGKDPVHANVAHPDHPFWTQVEIRGPNECWPWTGRTSPTGQPYANREYQYDGENRPYRIAHALTRGPIPMAGPFKRRTIRLNCMDSSCCNPAHSYQAAGRHSDEY